LEGRFPQTSGLYFEFDDSKPIGSRINTATIKVQNEPFVFEKVKSLLYAELKKNETTKFNFKIYRLATTFYLAQGKDGYIAFKEDCPVLVNISFCD
jgi:hypothetical protein